MRAGTNAGPGRSGAARNYGNGPMKLFTCQNCGQLLYFENIRCEKCGYRLAYMPSVMVLSALEKRDDAWTALADPATQVRFCENAGQDACNWLIDDDRDLPFCAA